MSSVARSARRLTQCLRARGRLVAKLALCAVSCFGVACSSADSAHQEVRTAEDCVLCHEPEYEAVKSPLHVGNFPTECGACHREDGWTPAKTFDHSKVFPLVDAHANRECSDCHKKSYRKGETPKECVGCHKDDYDRSPYPGHQSFPTTCDDCHTKKAWKPATGGAHPDRSFPIKTGKHAKIACNDCHNSALGANGKDNADCVGCHTGRHTRRRMDEVHHEVGGYPSGAAKPNFCLRCHADGRKHDD